MAAPSSPPQPAREKIAQAAALRALAERLGAPVVLTANARGLLHAHPLGVPASPSFGAVRRLVAESDAVLALGTEFGPTDYDMYGDGGWVCVERSLTTAGRQMPGAATKTLGRRSRPAPCRAQTKAARRLLPSAGAASPAAGADPNPRGQGFEPPRDALGRLRLLKRNRPDAGFSVVGRRVSDPA